jgi:hypothetical protein
MRTLVTKTYFITGDNAIRTFDIAMAARIIAVCADLSFSLRAPNKYR